MADEREHERLPGGVSTILDEARRRYDAESARSAVVENKIGTIVTIDALVISLVGSVSRVSTVGRVTSMLPAVLSAAIGLWTLRTRGYKTPGKAVDDLLEYAKMDPERRSKRLLVSYAVTVEDNRELTDSKYDSFELCMLLTFLSLVLVLSFVLVSPRFAAGG